MRGVEKKGGRGREEGREEKGGDGGEGRERRPYSVM